MQGAGDAARGEDAAGSGQIAPEPRVVLQAAGYAVKFDEHLLRDVNFAIRAGEKVALIGGNGAGKTTLLRDILKQENPTIQIDADTPFAGLSQLDGSAASEDRTVSAVLADAGLQSRQEMRDCLAAYTLPEGALQQKVSQLSGGEQNLLQLAVLARSGAKLLLLDRADQSFGSVCTGSACAGGESLPRDHTHGDARLLSGGELRGLYFADRGSYGTQDPQP